MPRITPIHWKKLACIFEKAGFSLDREVGSHLCYTKKGIKRPVIIPKYSEIDVDIINSNRRTAGMSREEYFEYLNQC